MTWFCLLLSLILHTYQSKKFEKPLGNNNLSKEYFWDVSVIPSDNSAQIKFGNPVYKHTMCTGYIGDYTTMKIVFHCRTDKNCIWCEDFSVDGLIPNRPYLLFLVEHLHQKPLHYNFSTTFHLIPTTLVTFTMMTIGINKSINLTATCSGAIYSIKPAKSIFSCENDIFCKNCDSFSLKTLTQDSEYRVDISTNISNINIKEDIHTPKFWIVDIKATNVSMYVDITRVYSVRLNCVGTVKKLSDGKDVYNCDRDPMCKACKSFTVPNLAPDTFYSFDIKTNFTIIGIYEKARTLYTFIVEKRVRFDMIEVMITKNFTTAIVCTGNVKEKATMKDVYDCSKNDDCKKCDSFNVTGLKPDTEYVVDITGNRQHVEIKFTVKTTLLWDIVANDNSITAYSNIYNTNNVNCSGDIWNIDDKFMVFNCSEDINCRTCNNFTVNELYANTRYRISLHAYDPINVDQIEEIKTTYHLSAILIPSYTSISFNVSRSVNLTALCTGKILKTSTGEVGFYCVQNYYCRFCVNFTLNNLEPNTKFTFDLTSSPQGIHTQEISTLKFWDVSTKSTFNSISVTINLLSRDRVECFGLFVDSKNKTIFNCSNDKKCQKCESFELTGLIPNEYYLINISTTYPTIKFVEAIKTDDIFEKFINISFFSVSFQTNKKYNITTSCSGVIVEMKTGYEVFDCSKDNCSLCESFEVHDLKENTFYVASLLVNGVYNFFNTTFKTEPIWRTTFVETSETITTNIQRYYKDKMTCDGTVTQVGQTTAVFNCSQNNECSMCNSFMVEGLHSDTEYTINITSNINSSEITKTVKTLNLLNVSYSVKNDEIMVLITKDPHAYLSCSGNAYEVKTHDVVFNCSQSPTCKKCESFTITGLLSETNYTIDIKTNVSGVNIFSTLKTDKYELKVKKILSHPTSIDIEITPSYQIGGMCNLTLYDSDMKKINITCSKKCPSDCNKLNFTLIDLTKSSTYTLVISSQSLQENVNVFLFTNSINYTLRLTYMNETEFHILAMSNTTKYTKDVCNYTVLHIQSGNKTYYSNDCFTIVVKNITKGNSYEISLDASLSSAVTKPFLVYTLPFGPEHITFYQLNNTALRVNAKLDISQVAPVYFMAIIVDENGKVIWGSYNKDLQTRSQALIANYIDVKSIVNVLPLTLPKVGSCAFIDVPYCSLYSFKYCSTCVYTRVPIFFISFTYPGDVSLVSVGNDPTKLRMVLPKFIPSNKWIAVCSIFVAKLLHLRTLPNELPDNFDVINSVYKKNNWALLYRSFDFYECELLQNVTFGDKKDKNQLNLDFVSENLYYAGALQLCRHSTCVSSKLSNIEFISSQKQLNTQLILFIIALFLALLLFAFMIATLVLRNLKLIHRNNYDVKSTKKQDTYDSDDEINHD